MCTRKVVSGLLHNDTLKFQRHKNRSSSEMIFNGLVLPILDMLCTNDQQVAVAGSLLDLVPFVAQGELDDDALRRRAREVPVLAMWAEEQAKQVGTGIMAVYIHWSQQLVAIGGAPSGTPGALSKRDFVLQIALAGLQNVCTRLGTDEILKAVAELATQDTSKAQPDLFAALMQFMVCTSPSLPLHLPPTLSLMQ